MAALVANEIWNTGAVLPNILKADEGWDEVARFV
jgi:hypothetical protein